MLTIAIIINKDRKSFNYLYSRSKTIKIKIKKINVFKVVIDISFRSFIKLLIYIYIFGKQKDTVNKDDSLK